MKRFSALIPLLAVLLLHGCAPEAAPLGPFDVRHTEGGEVISLMMSRDEVVSRLGEPTGEGVITVKDDGADWTDLWYSDDGAPGAAGQNTYLVLRNDRVTRIESNRVTTCHGLGAGDGWEAVLALDPELRAYGGRERAYIYYSADGERVGAPAAAAACVCYRRIDAASPVFEIKLIHIEDGALI